MKTKVIAAAMLLAATVTAGAVMVPANPTGGGYLVQTVSAEEYVYYQDVSEYLIDAPEGTYQFEYRLDSTTHTATLVDADMAHYRAYEGATVTIPEIITYNGENYTVTTIGEQAFSVTGSTSHGSYVKEVILPETITTINDHAFYHCEQLETINLPDGITSIESHAFARCTSLKHIHIPTSLKVISESAFSQCWAADELVIPEGVTTIGEEAFNEYGKNSGKKQTLMLPSTLTFIDVNAFRNCNTFTKVVFTEGNNPLTMENAFNGCEKIEKVTFSSNTELINGFRGATSLTQVIIPNGVKQLGNSAFSDIAGLALIEIPPSVTNISSTGCINLNNVGPRTIYLPETTEFQPYIPSNYFPNGNTYLTLVRYTVNSDNKTVTVTDVWGVGADDETFKLQGTVCGMKISAVPEAYRNPDKHTHYYGVNDESPYCLICDTLDPDHTHQWAEPVWQWSEDLSSADVVLSCAAEPNHANTYKAEVTSTVTTPATCTQTGLMTYTATVTVDEETFTNTRTAAIPTAEHQFADGVCVVCGAEDPGYSDVGYDTTPPDFILNAGGVEEVSVSDEDSGIVDENGAMTVTIDHKTLSDLVIYRRDGYLIHGWTAEAYIPREVLKELYVNHTSCDIVLEFTPVVNPEGTTRPAYQIDIYCLKNGAKTPIELTTGEISVWFPYTIAPGEDSASLTVVTLDADGKVQYLENASYEDGKMTFAIRKSGVYGVGYAE